MKIIAHRLFAAGAAAWLTLGLHAQATPLGLDSVAPYVPWVRSTSDTAFAIWDTFPDFTYSGAAPATSFGLGNALGSQALGKDVTNQGAGLIGNATTQVPGNDILNTGGNDVSFVLSGQIHFLLGGFVLQIKRAGNVGGMADFFLNSGLSLQINGGASLAPDAAAINYFGSGDTNSSGNYSVTTWYWSNSLAGVTQGADNGFTLVATSIAGHRAIDGLSVDASSQAVPEPGSATLLLGACGLSLLLLRRRLHS